MSKIVTDVADHLRVGYRVEKMCIVGHSEKKDEWTLRCDCGTRRRYKTHRLLRLFPSQCSQCQRQSGGAGFSSAEIEVRDYKDDEREMIERFLEGKR